MASDIDMSINSPSRSVLHRAFPALRLAPATTTSADFSLPLWSAFQPQGEISPGKGTRPFTAQPPHLRRLALGHKSFAVACLLALAGAASNAIRVPRLTVYAPRFLHASSPRSVALTQLRFTCLAVASSAGDLHPEDRAHAGRTSTAIARAMASICNDEWVRFGVVSGHDRKTLSLSVQRGLSAAAGIGALVQLWRSVR